MRLTGFILTGLLSIFAGSAASAAPAVELTIDGTPHQGKPLAHNRSICWLETRSGRLLQVNLSQVTEFRRLDHDFRPCTSVDLRNQLRSEWGQQLDVIARGDFVVCADHDNADADAALLLDVQRSFHAYFSRRGFKLPPLEFPLVVTILPTQAEFTRVALEDKLTVLKYLRGYYHPRSNRVVLYRGERAATRETLIHETVHQLAFNYGLHSRIGRNPRWVVEGLATMLEVDAMKSNRTSARHASINQDRLRRFRDYQRHRRTSTIAEFIADDESHFRANTLDAYSTAWAFTYFLAETRPRKYFRYLKRIAERDPLDTTDSITKRTKDFTSIFGSDMKWIEVQFLRFVDELQ